MSVLTPNQELFSSHLAKLTGLDPNVIRGWTLAEESSSAAAKRQAQGNNNWLNIGYFDSGAASWAKGGGPFANPQSAAAATAQFLKGQRWGASSGIQKILSTAGLTPQQQIAAIAKSGWASSGYGGGTNLLKTYGLVSGTPAPTMPATTTTPTAPTLPGQTTTEKRMVASQSVAKTVTGILNAKTQTAALGQFRAGQPHEITIDTSPTVAQTGVSPNAPAVVQEIKKYLGTPYVWGGSKPGGFDCSGLLQYVWAQKGVKIPRTTYQQIKAGMEVPLKSLQPGDAVFFGSSSNPHHVGMYIGHGQFVEAPHTGAQVRISNLNDRLGDYVTARRFG